MRTNARAEDLHIARGVLVAYSVKAGVNRGDTQRGDRGDVL